MAKEAIVFLNPPYKYAIQRKLRCSPRRCGYIFPPLELLYLASVINKKDNLELVFIDAIAENITSEEIIRRLKKYRVRIIIFMPGFESFGEDLKTLCKIKGNINKDCCIASFGYLPTLYYEDIFSKFPLINYVILGEPEKTFSELCDAVLTNSSEMKIKGLAINNSGKSIVNPTRENEVNLDSFPFPDRALLRNDCYADPFLKKPMTAVLTSRGCPYGCIFCVNFYGRTFRQRSAANVIGELEQIVRDHNIHNIRFMDDSFTVDRNRIINICKAMIDNRLRLNWTCLSRADNLDEEMLDYMSESGCKAIFLGIESGSQKVIDYYRKGYSVDSIKKQCKLIKTAGISIVSWFIIGAPVETGDDVKKSLKLSLEIDSDFVCINELQLMPTAGILSELKGCISLSLFPFKIAHKQFRLSHQEVSWLRKKFYIGFYLAPKTIRKLILLFIRKPLSIAFFIKEFISAVNSKYVEK